MTSAPTAGNPSGHRETLLHATSEDGYQFAGWLCEPGAADAKPPLVIWVHGLHLSFANPEYCAIGRAAAAKGVAFLSVQTKGHDFGTWVRGPGGTKLVGSGWEIFTECLADLGGWLAAARALGFERIVLAGHGYGAAKVVFFQAERQDRGVRGVVVASSGSLVRDVIDATQLATAERMVAEGRGQDLMPWGTRRGSLQSSVSAQVYVSRARVHRDLYGYGDVPPALSRVQCPVLAWFGDREQRADRDVNVFLDTMRRNATRAPQVQTRLLRDTNYLYQGAEATVARELVRWVMTLEGDAADE